MSAESILLVLFGMAFGGWLGYQTAWVQARKLEFFEVTLKAWDEDDWHGEKKKPAQVHSIGGRNV